MIDKFNKGSDLFFQIKTFLRNCPFRPPLFPLTPLFLLCRLRPSSPSVCTGASFCTRTAPFPLPVCTGASSCTRTAPFSPSVCTAASFCTREGRSENIAKNLKDSFYNNSFHTSQNPTPGIACSPPPVQDWRSTGYDAPGTPWPHQSWPTSTLGQIPFRGS